MKNPKKVDDRILAVGERLKEIRIEKGWTSYESFAWENGLSRMQYWRIEKGKNMTLESLLKILDIHGMTFAEFFARTTEKENNVLHKTKHL